MTVFISRDYNLGVTGYIAQPFGGSYGIASTGRFHVGYMYQLSIFLRKILGYTTVGQTSWNIDNTNVKSLVVTLAASPSTTIAVASNGQSLPQATINVASTTNFTSTGVIYVTTSAGAQQAVSYTGITGTTFTGCSGGTGSMATGGAITTPQITVTTAAAHGLIDGYVVSIVNGTGNGGVNGTWKAIVINATQIGLFGSYNTGSYNASTATLTTGFLYSSGLVSDGYGAGINFGAGALTDVAIPISKKSVSAADVGRVLALKSNLFPTKNAGCFKISAINVGNTTTIAAGSNGAALPQATINVVSTTGFPTSGTFFVNTGTTIAAGSNGASLPQATINVASTSGFPTSGTIFVVTSGGTQTVTYTGTGATTFTGCAGGTGTMSTGGAVTGTNPAQTITYTGVGATTFTGCTGGTGTLATGASVTNLNRYVIDYRATEVPPMEPANSIDWWLYETESIASGYLSKYYGGSLGVGTTTNATPIQVQTDSNFPHTWVTGQKINVSGQNGNTNANGIWTITQVDSTHFTLNGSVGNGAGSASGSAVPVGYPGGPASGAVSINSRVIYQSPHASAWQVRIAAEPISANLPNITISVGYGGTSTGDFPPGATFTNVGEFLDVNPATVTTYNNLMVGAGNSQLPTTQRISMVGDDLGQSVIVYSRTTGSTAINGLLVFGIPSNEPVPTPANTDRLFCYGSASTSDFGQIILRTGAALNVGNAIKNSNIELMALTGWANLDGTSATSPLLSANAADSPFTNTTEILPIEIWSGANADIAVSGATTPPISYNARFMGTAQHLRNGRNNFTIFSLTTDDITVRNISAATNATPIQITTSTTNGLVTGQTVTIYGVTGNTAANGTFIITVLNNTQFTLNGSAGNGAFTGQLTTIAAGSNGATLPQATINVASTVGFPASGTIYVTTSTGVSTVNYTGTSGGTQFTGCTGGTGSMTTGGGVSTSVINGAPQWFHLQNGIYLRWNGSFGLTP